MENLRAPLLLLMLLFGRSNSLSFTYEIEEEAPVGYTFPTTLLHQLPTEKFNHAKEISFFKMNNNEVASYFDVGLTDGLIKIVKRIDFENPKIEKLNGRLKFVVSLLNDGEINGSIDVIVKVKDINDNGCRFVPSMRQTVSFREDARPGVAKKSLNRPQDADKHFSIKKSKIYLVTPSTMFQLKTTKLYYYDKPYNVELVLMKPLDYEEEKSYDLTVRASDGNASHTCDLDVTVNVEDVNDNFPEFTKEVYSTNVSEAASIGSVILKVTAFDKDTGDHGTIRYSIDRDTPMETLRMFSIDDKSGNITLTSKLNYNEKNYFHFLVSANNGESMTGMKRAIIKINVDDVNDKSPVITVRKSTGGTNVFLEEGQISRKDFAYVMVEDEDTGPGGSVTCELTESSSKDAFSLTFVNDKIYKVSVLKAFDREVETSVHFTIECQDKGTPPQVSSKRIDVPILDINDNSPIFARTEYSIDVLEDNAPSRAAEKYTLLTVYATDEDAGKNGTIVYSIRAATTQIMSLIRVDENSGRIFTNANLNREELDSFSFEVIATDKGEPQPRSATAKVHVTVLDFNDHEPRFDKNEYVFSIAENTPRNTFVGTISAFDQDIGINRDLEFSLIKSSGLYAKLPFMLGTRLSSRSNRYSVKVYTFGDIDREALISSRRGYVSPVYHFKVLAVDKGNPQRTGQVSVKVHIMDVNDEAPRFTFPKGNKSEISVSYLEQAGYQFARITAKDRDAGNNGTVSYRIISGDSSAYFSLDSKDGSLLVARPMPKSLVGKHVLRVGARDGGYPSRESRATVYVRVDESAPLGVNGGAGDSSASAINLYIIIAIVVASFIISMVLLTAICVVLRRSRRENHRHVQYKASGDYASYPLNPQPPPTMPPMHNFYESATLPPLSTQARREVTFLSAPSVDNITLGPLKPPPPYHSVPGEDKRSSLASGDRDSGNGDSVDVNPARCAIHGNPAHNGGGVGVNGGAGDFYGTIPGTGYMNPYSSTMVSGGGGTVLSKTGGGAAPLSGTSTFVSPFTSHRLKTFSAGNGGTLNSHPNGGRLTPVHVADSTASTSLGSSTGGPVVTGTLTRPVPSTGVVPVSGASNPSIPPHAFDSRNIISMDSNNPFVTNLPGSMSNKNKTIDASFV